MSDTGAPWNLPYPLNTDLVRDGAVAIKDLAEATATGLSAAGNAGIGSNVVQTFKTDVFSTASTTFTDLSGLSATITPTSATSKILVISHISFGGPNTQTFQAELRRGSTSVGIATTGADPSSAQVSANVNIFASNAFHVFLDSPGVATATTYSWRVKTNSGTLLVNRWNVDTTKTVTSSITLIEVAP
jgi:hypothetical protein